MSISAESTNGPQTEEDLLEYLDQAQAEPPINADPRKPTHLRGAAGGPWVIVPPGFVLTPDDPPEIVLYSYDLDEDHSAQFLVVASVVDNPVLLQQFEALIEEQFSDISTEPAEPQYRFNIRTPSQLHERHTEIQKIEFLIEGLLYADSLDILVGDSGLGKSPLLYQAAVCVAEAIPFLGHKVHAGRVLYLECENGVRLSDRICSQVAKHVGVSYYPKNLAFWNMNDCTEKYSIEDLINEFRPDWVIVDPYKAFFPEIEVDSKHAIVAYQRLRKIKAAHRCSITGIHHIRKPGEHPQFLDQGSAPPWFQQARGAREIINGIDMRIGFDLPSSGEPNRRVLRGYGRGGEEIPLHLLETVLDGDGEPQGFRVVSGTNLLNEEQQLTFVQLKDIFRFSEAMATYGKKDQATKDFLQKCIGANILRKVERGVYQKIPAQG